MDPETIARIRKEWQEEIWNETNNPAPRNVGHNGGRLRKFFPEMLDDLLDLTIAQQMEKLGCGRKTIDRLRTEHPYYIERKQTK
jgi:hypothetical protein